MKRYPKRKVIIQRKAEKMKLKIAIAILISLFLTSFLLSEKIKEKDLPQKYKDFLDFTRYIIRPQEKDVFLQLTMDRDRDIFIEAFWKQRDPTPGTAENEYRDEHLKRFNYVNKFFKRGSPRKGWMTDMGRFYIILGPPASIERFYGTLDIYPCEVWYYYGDSEKGLPTHFALIFYQKGGAGEFKLYDPVSDGPANLMIHGKDFAIEDYEGMYERLMELAPTLADVSLSLIPGEIPYNYAPSPRNTILLAEIIESPKKDVNHGYATHFLSYKGLVTTEYMTNFIENEASTAFIPDPVTGINFLHFSIVPKSISLDYYEPKDQFFCNFSLDVSLRKKDDIIFQYSKEFPLYFASDEIQNLRANGLSLEDSFPVVEGDYKLTILLRNSVGKEFSIYEKDISIPEAYKTAQIVGPFIGYKFQEYQSNLHIPFKVMDKKLVVDPKNTFSGTDDISFCFNLMNISQVLGNEGKLRVEIKGLRKESPTEKSLTLMLKDYQYRKILPITYSLPAKELSPDYYEMSATLLDGKEKAIDEKKATFIVSPEQAISHPVARARSISLANSYHFYYMLAHQYSKVNELEKAEASFEKAYTMKPDYKKGLTEYAIFLIKAKKFNKSLALVENIKDDESLKFDYYLIRGRALLGTGNYPEAIASLLEGNKIYNSDIGLLNSLGFCYYKTQQKEKALEVFKASLSLNPVQEEVKKLVEEVNKIRD